jgi:hypothetical protein
MGPVTNGLLRKRGSSVASVTTIGVRPRMAWAQNALLRGSSVNEMPTFDFKYCRSAATSDTSDIGAPNRNETARAMSSYSCSAAVSSSAYSCNAANRCASSGGRGASMVASMLQMSAPASDVLARKRSPQ